VHVALIEPPKFYSPTNQTSTIVIPPLGPAYVAASLEAAGHRVSAVDAIAGGIDRFRPFRGIYLRGLSPEEICERVPADSELIAVGCMFSAGWLAVRELVRALRERLPGVPIVLGGEHATALPELSLEQAPVDYVVLGEGEATMVDLVGRLARGEPAEDTPGTRVRQRDGSTRANPRRPRILDVDALPLPAWHLYDVERYIEFSQPHGTVRGRFMPMLATRGCPFRCTFCTSPNTWTQRWVARSPKLVVDEIELYGRRYGATDIHFEDLTAIVRKDWIVEFCRELVERKVEISFQLPSGTRSEAVDEETAHWLRRAGCHEFTFAPESGDPRVLRAIEKRVSLPRLFQAARFAMREGIQVSAFFIVGFPEDTHASVWRTLRAIGRCALEGFSGVMLGAYSPQPSTASFRRLQASGRIREIDDEYLLDLFRFEDLGSRKTSYSERLSSRAVTVYVWLGFAIFYALFFAARPWRLAIFVRDLFQRSKSNKSARAASNLLRDRLALRRSGSR